jgi:hypothetical protein
VVIDWPAVAFVGIDNDELVGTGGIAWGADRCWLWFSAVGKPKPSYGLYVVRMAHKLFRKAFQLGEVEIFTVRDRNFSTSLRLHQILGFTPHSLEKGQEIWSRRLDQRTEVHLLPAKINRIVVEETP